MSNPFDVKKHKYIYFIEQEEEVGITRLFLLGLGVIANSHQHAAKSHPIDKHLIKQDG
jgi:hypothetical protein